MLIKNIFKTRTPDILECIANLSSDEVFTPPQVANKILDLLPKEVWSNPELKFLDPVCKTGIFLRECVKRLMIGLESSIPDEEKRREHIFKNMLYGIAITEITSMISRRSLYYSKEANTEYSVVKLEKSEGNIVYENQKHKFKNRKCIYCGAAEMILSRGESLEAHAYQFIHQDINNLFKNMKFDVIIGNPPYQLNSGGYGAQAIPIYHKFIETAMSLQPRYLSMIIPSRWFSGGMGLNEFRSRMLSDKRMKVLVDYPNAEECFPGVEIKGGVCYFLWDSKYHGPCNVVSMFNGELASESKRFLDEHDTFVRFNESINILKKIKFKNEKTLDQKVMGIDPFKFPTNFKGYKKNKFNNSVSIYIRGDVGYINNKDVVNNRQLINKYKVLLAQASEGKGVYPNNIIGKPILAGKNSCCSFTYIIVNHFNREVEAKNFIVFLKTRFVRFLISLKKSTQHLSKDKFSFVPDLDMSQEWTDEKLYKRYGITEKEQEFIKSIVKEMP